MRVEIEYFSILFLFEDFISISPLILLLQMCKYLYYVLALLFVLCFPESKGCIVY